MLYLEPARGLVDGSWLLRQAGSVSVLPLALIFLASSGVIWWAGTKLSLSTDIIDHRFRLGDVLGGLIFLSIATNLPELAITVSAVLSHHFDIAIGNLIGGIAIETVVLALVDAVEPENRPLSYLAGSLLIVLEAMLVISIVAVTILATQLPPSVKIFTVSPASVIIVLGWLAGLVLINRIRHRNRWKTIGPEAKPGRTHLERLHMGVEHRLAKHSTAYVITVFSIGALATLGAGVALEETGNQLANQLGIGSGIFAGTVMAAVTALPEVSTGIASAQIGDNALAMSDIIGGNAFGPVLFILADILAGGPVLPHANSSEIWLAGLGIVLTTVYVGGLIIRPRKQFLRMGVDSILVVLLYVFGIVGLVALR